MKKDFTPFVKKAAALLTILLYCHSQLAAQTSVSGNVQGTWTKANSPYIITTSIAIRAGQTLTIEPGVEVRLSYNPFSGFFVQGTLKAEGTVTDSIKFTGYYPYGSPAAADHAGPVTVEAGSVNTSFAYVKMDGLGYQTPNDTLAAVVLRFSSCSIRNCSLVNIQGTGIRIDSSGALLAGNSFSTSHQDILTGFNNLPALSVNTGLKVGLLPRMTADAVIERGNTYKLLGSLTVPQGSILTLKPGAEIRLMPAKSQLTVLGTLKAEGTASDSVRLTSEFAGAANSGTVGPVILSESSTNNSLKWANLSGLGYIGGQFDTSGVLIVRSPSTVIQNTSFENISGTAINTNNGSTLISGNRFSTLGLDVVTSADYLSSITGNQALKIGITGLSLDATFTRSNLFYRVLRSLTIPAGKMLTIEPGAELQFPSGSGEINPLSTSQINIQGTLKAEGTAVDSIRFTGMGDYAVRGSQIGPLVITASSVNTSLKWVSINGLGFASNADNSAAVVIRSASCIVQNCSFRNIRGTGINYDVATLPLNDSRPQILNNSFSTANLDVVIAADKLYKLSGNGPLKVGLLSGTADARLTRENTYKVLGTLTVPPGTTLTVDPGVAISFPTIGNTYVLNVRGTLKAEGTPTDSIRFIGGPLTDQFDYRAIRIDTGSVNSSMKWVRIEGFGYNNPGDENRGAMEISHGSFSLQHCSLNIIGSGVAINLSGDQSSPLITDNSFTTTRLDVCTPLDHVQALAGNAPLKIGLVSANMFKDDTLYARHRFYRLVNNMGINPIRTLTIEPGVRVEFPRGTYGTSTLLIGGTLNATGTAEKNIMFTGVTGKSAAITVASGPVVIAAGSRNSSLQWVKIDSMGSNIDYTSSVGDPPAALIVRSPTCSISNVTIQNSAKIGLALLNAGSPFITNACFSNNYGGAVLSAGGSPTFVHSNFVNDYTYGINNTSPNTADTVHAENCWWGSASGPNHFITNPAGTGDIVSNKVSYTPWNTAAFPCAGGAGTLPLTLTGFSVSLLSGAVQCAWQTTAETSTSHFIIQRSKEGSSFTDIGRVNAAGNSSRTISYRFTDGVPGSGPTYYRLKMVDKDRAATYSNVLLVTIGSQSTATVFPNPVHDRLFVQLHNRMAQAVTIRVLDMKGKMLLQERRQMQSGTTTVSLPVASLAKGTYVVQIEGRVKERKIFVKE